MDREVTLGLNDPQLIKVPIFVKDPNVNQFIKVTPPTRNYGIYIGVLY